MTREETLALRELEGIYAYLSNDSSESCPYDGEEQDAWLMGYASQKTQSFIIAKNILLRQAIKSQAEQAALVDGHTKDDWQSYLTEAAAAALRETPDKVAAVENVIKDAVPLYTKNALKVTENGIEVDYDKMEILEGLLNSIYSLLKSLE